MRRIAFLIYPDFQIVDATGPLAAFEIAGRYRPDSYALEVVAARPGLVRSSAGAGLQAAGLPPAAGTDTLIVAGGNGVQTAADCPTTTAVEPLLRAATRR